MRVLRYFKPGQAATELAMAVPVLALLLVGTADFARAFYFNQEVIAAARAGAQFGSESTGNAADTTGIQAAAVANATNIPGFAAADVSTSSCTCGLSTGGCASSYCNGANAQATYVTVTATATFTTLVNYPGIPHSTSMSDTAIMQVQTGS